MPLQIDYIALNPQATEPESMPDGAMYYNSTSEQVEKVEGGTTTPVDIKSKVSVNDTTTDFLEDKIVAGSNVTVSVLSEGGNEQLSIASTGGGGETVTYSTTISSWTSDGDLYRADVTHNLATKDIQVHTYLTSNDKTVDVEEIERTSTNIVRIWVASEENLRVCVVSAGGGGGSSSVPSFAYNAHELLSPNTSDWTVNALAPVSADSNNSALNVRLFDDTAEEGTGFLVEIPSGSTNINFKFKSRAETAPGAARTVGLKLYNRGLPNNGAVESWSSGNALTDISMPASELWQYDSQEIALSTLGVTAGEMTQFELTRINPTAGTELVGDWALLNLIVEFT